MPTVERAFVFADLSGYTALTEAHGDDRAAEVALRFAAFAREATAGEGEIVKTLGDAVMLALPDAVSALRIVGALCARLNAEDRYPAIRVGVHVGPAVCEGNDYFGATVNLAARVAAHAGLGQVLCTEQVAACARELVGVTFRVLGEVTFKNVSSPTRVFEVVLPTEPASYDIDPVCRMRVDSSAEAVRVEHDGSAVVFCSQECATRFRESPGAFK